MNINIKLYGLVMVSAVGMAFTSFSKHTISNKEITGAWGYGPAENRTIMINTEKVFSVVTYDFPGKRFISTYGGTWRIEGNRLIKNIEWKFRR